MRAYQVRLELNGFLEQADTFIEPLLLESNPAENGLCGGARFRIGERGLDLLLGLVEAALLNQGRRSPKGVLGVNTRNDARESPDGKDAGRDAGHALQLCTTIGVRKTAPGSAPSGQQGTAIISHKAQRHRKSLCLGVSVADCSLCPQLSRCPQLSLRRMPKSF